MGVSLHEGLAGPGSPCHVNDYVAPLSVGWHELCKRHPAVLGEALSGGHPVVPVSAPPLEQADRAAPDAQYLRPIPRPWTERKSSGFASILRALLPLPMWICRAAFRGGLIMREAPAMVADDVPSAGQCPAVPFEPAPRHARSRAIFRFRAYPVASTRFGGASGRAGWPSLHAAPDPVCLHVRHHGDDGLCLHRRLAVASTGAGAVAGRHGGDGEWGAVDADGSDLGPGQ